MATTAPFFPRLREYFEQVNAVLKGVADASSIFPNPTDIGTSREAVYAEFLRQHLPTNCNVMFGGFSFGMDGSESRQIDIIVTTDICPQFNLHNRQGSGKTFACIDGTVAVVSVKSRLNKAELLDALDNLCTLPEKEPLDNRKPPNLEILGYGDWPFKVIFASDGISTASLLKTLNQYCSEKAVPPQRRPNMIHVAGKTCIIRVGPSGGQWAGRHLQPDEYFSLDVTDAYGLLYAVTNIQLIAGSARQVSFDYGPILRRIDWR